MTQEVSGVYTSSFSDTDELKMALRARKVSGPKRAPGHRRSDLNTRLWFVTNKACFIFL